MARVKHDWTLYVECVAKHYYDWPKW